MPTYTIAGSGIGYSGGNYKSDSPIAAAKKAGRQLFRKINNDREYQKYKNKSDIKFILRQKASGVPGKTFGYMVTQKKLKSPKTITRGNIEIKIEYEYDVKPTRITDKEHVKMLGGDPNIPIDIVSDPTSYNDTNTNPFEEKDLAGPPMDAPSIDSAAPEQTNNEPAQEGDASQQVGDTAAAPDAMPTEFTNNVVGGAKRRSTKKTGNKKGGNPPESAVPFNGGAKKGLKKKGGSDDAVEKNYWDGGAKRNGRKKTGGNEIMESVEQSIGSLRSLIGGKAKRATRAKRGGSD